MAHRIYPQSERSRRTHDADLEIFRLPSCANHESASDLIRDLAKHLDKAVDVRLVIIDMRRDAQATEAWRDVNVLLRELLDQPVRHPLGKSQAENMRRAHPLVGDQHAGIAQ